MTKRSLVAAFAAAVLGLLAVPTSSSARPATTDVTWRLDQGSRDGSIPAGCYDPKITSSKDISNLVYVIDGETIRIEFEDGTNEYVVPGEVTEIWVKSGNNKGGDGPGLGQHFIPVENVNCTGGGGGSGSA